jgi:hypothetical protein
MLAMVLPLTVPLEAQWVQVRSASPEVMPGPVDSNSPAYWTGGTLHLLNSTSAGPMLSAGPDQSHLGAASGVQVDRNPEWPVWIESAWADSSGAILGWYHQEPPAGCPGTWFAEPRIGAAISWDEGNTFQDLGIVLSAAYPVDCSAQNGYVAGGEGDFSVVVDRGRHYIYFLFSSYSGPLENQGVAVARIPFEHRFDPAGSALKYYQGGWTEPGIGGRVSPIFPARTSWSEADTDSFWGPSIHYNTYLDAYVMLLNRSCCSPGYPQQAIYAAYGTDLAAPELWSQPAPILETNVWYPEVLGIAPGETDSTAGRVARLYLRGRSEWEIVFALPGDASDTPPPEREATVHDR